MRSYGEIEVTRSGLVAVALEAKKLKLAPPVQKEHEAKVQTQAQSNNGVLK
jgi:hypothetical protein